MSRRNHSNKKFSPNRYPTPLSATKTPQLLSFSTLLASATSVQPAEHLVQQPASNTYTTTAQSANGPDHHAIDNLDTHPATVQPAELPTDHHATNNASAHSTQHNLIAPISICDLPDSSTNNQWPIPGLLPSGLCLLSSKSPADARTLALQLALSIASDTPALDNYAPTPGQALYFSFHEHQLTFTARARLLLNTAPLPHNLAFSSGAPGTTPWLEHAIAILTQSLQVFPHTRLIVIDSLTSLFPPDRAWSTRRKQALLDQLNHLAHNHHLCILILHTQARHCRQDPFDAIALSPTLREAIETLLVLEHNRTQTHATLHITSPLTSTHRLQLHMPTDAARWHLNESETTSPDTPNESLHAMYAPTTDDLRTTTADDARSLFPNIPRNPSSHNHIT